MTTSPFTSLACLLLFFSLSVGAKEKGLPLSVHSEAAGDLVVSAPSSGLVTRSGKREVGIKIHNSCFGTNLRGVGNPLAPSSLINANLRLVIAGKEYPITVQYPAMLVTAHGMTNGNITPMSPSKYSLPSGGSVGIYGNSVIMKTNIPTGASVDNEGNVQLSGLGAVYLKSYSFVQQVTSCSGGPVYGAYGHSASQAVYPCGSFMGKNGTLSASFGGISIAPDNSNIDIYVSFPGQTGFCGGYWSPLMLFTSETLPQFKAISSFPLNPLGKTRWPEAGSPGWFLALDRDRSGKIDQRSELFGDSTSQQNGFEVLKELDSNKDGFISAKDKDFKRLILWQDKNGDGVSQDEEMIFLSEKLVKISLQYTDSIVTPLGKYAEARERAKFWYKDKKEVKKGDIIDIWLAPVSADAEF